MYRWRKLTPVQRGELLAWRKRFHHPWHRPPHPVRGEGCFHITASCYEHAPFIGTSPERLAEFSNALLEALGHTGCSVHAWCVLPNHYHFLATCSDLNICLAALAKLHGRTSYTWNKGESARGRKVWSPAADRAMRSGDHFWATVNYVHHNPVRHRYVEKWQDWPFSSVHDFFRTMGRDEMAHLWRSHPVDDYGAGWDEPSM